MGGILSDQLLVILPWVCLVEGWCFILISISDQTPVGLSSGVGEVFHIDILSVQTPHLHIRLPWVCLMIGGGVIHIDMNITVLYPFLTTRC